MQKGRIITFESACADRSNTQLNLSIDYLRSKGHKVSSPERPLRYKIKTIIDSGDTLTPKSRLLLDSVEFPGLIGKVIECLRQEQVILLGNFLTYLRALHQYALGAPKREFDELLNFIIPKNYAAHSLSPDLTLIYDVNPLNNDLYELTRQGLVKLTEHLPRTVVIHPAESNPDRLFNSETKIHLERLLKI